MRVFPTDATWSLKAYTDETASIMYEAVDH
jgi:hypothetical protein